MSDRVQINQTHYCVADIGRDFNVSMGNVLEERPQRLDGYSLALNATSSFRYALGKRAFDALCSASLILLLLPVLTLIYIAIKLTSPGPVLYREKRVGRWGTPFTILKFRTMHTVAHLEHKGIVLSTEQIDWLRTHGKGGHDPRITRVGSFLRQWSLDELPQLFNVLFGDMSLVGPRPVVSREHVEYGDYRCFYDLVMPGISGLWQVSGRSNVAFEKRVEIDASYATNWSLLFDFRILLKTFSAVLEKTGAY
jgi:lipopolysaccharide/colanic/teichoic acid biosynthesis glycosyltransferase